VPQDLPDELTLVRKLRPWEQEEAVELLRALFAKHTSLAADSVTVELVGFAAGEIPAGELEWSLAGVPRTLNRPARVGLLWRDRGGRTGMESVTAKIGARARALTAKTDLTARTQVRAEDFELAEAVVDDPYAIYPDVFPEGETQILKRSLHAGGLLEASLLEERPEVERGAIVELLLEMGGVRLRAPARAEGPGSAGDLVPFRNLGTNRRVLARVKDSQNAEVLAR
jgi:flagella basal body P-ring formation protein FlgA